MSGLFARRHVALALSLVTVGAVFALIVNEDSCVGSPWLRIGLRVVLVALLLRLWFLTQGMIGARVRADAGIGDLLHDLTAPWHRRLLAHPKTADRMLVVSSAFIDLTGIGVLLLGVFGGSVRPLVALTLLYAMRQVCQKLCSLPPPPGMIWRHPGVPSLLVTYKVGEDFFFSGHTALTALAALEMGRVSPVAGAAGAALTAAQALVVLTLRAHYTMDVFAAVTAAVCAAAGADRICAALAV